MNTHDRANKIMKMRHGEELRSRQIQSLAEAVDEQIGRLERRIQKLEEITLELRRVEAVSAFGRNIAENMVDVPPEISRAVDYGFADLIKPED